MKLGFQRELWMNDVAEFVAVVIAAMFGPWWSFVIVVWLASFDRARKNHESVISTALVSTFAWFTIAFVRDAMNGFRISKRIGGFFSLPHGSLLYVVLCAIAFALSAAAAASGSQLGRFNRPKATR